MDTTELRQKKPEELDALILELLREQFNLRMQKGSGFFCLNSAVSITLSLC